MSFTGKVVLVTGSTTGIGEACARVLRRSRAPPSWFAGRNATSGHARRRCAFTAAGGAAQFIAVGFARQRAPASGSSPPPSSGLGGLDVLVNNAGILYTANALETTNEQWLDTMAVNVNCLFYMSRAAVKHMKAVGKGVDRQRRLGMGTERRAESCRLLREQGSGRADHALHGARSCARQHPDQLRVPRRDPHAHGR